MPVDSSYSTQPYGLPYGKLDNAELALPNNPWPALYGPGRYQMEKQPYNPRNRSTWVLPDAYVGQNTRLRDEIELAIINEDSWHFVVLPWEVTTDTRDRVFNLMTFDPAIAAQVPELGNFRIVTSQKESKTAKFIRMGIGYYMEEGFFNSPEGIQYHFETLRQISNACLESSKVSVILALKNCESYHRTQAIKQSIYREKSIEGLFNDELWFFACIQKTHEYALGLLDNKVGDLIRKNRGKATTWIVHEKTRPFFKLVPKENLHYDKMGSSGPDYILDRKDALTDLLGTPVFLSRSYWLDKKNGFVDMFSDQMQIGECYFVGNPDRENVEHYTSQACSIEILNDDISNWEKIGLEYCVEYASLFDEFGNLTDPASGKDMENTWPVELPGPDAETDVFKYYDENTKKMHLATHFGQLPPSYFTPNNVLKWVETLLKQLKITKSNMAVESMMVDFNNGLALLQRLDEIRYDGADAVAFKTEIDNIFVTNATVDVKARRVFPVKEVRQSPITGFLEQQNQMTKLLPGLQSFPGMAFFSTANVDDALKNDQLVAKKFVDTIRSLVSSLRSMVGNSLFTSADSASPWWQYPNAETAFLESLMPFRPPLFINEGQTLQVDEDLETQFFINGVFRSIDENKIFGTVGLTLENQLRKLYVLYQSKWSGQASLLNAQDILNGKKINKLQTLSQERKFILESMINLFETDVNFKRTSGFTNTEEIGEILAQFERNVKDSFAQYEEYAKKNQGVIKTGTSASWIQYPFLVGKNFARQILEWAEAAAAGGQAPATLVMPGDLVYPDVPSTLAKLKLELESKNYGRMDNNLWEMSVDSAHPWHLSSLFIGTNAHHLAQSVTPMDFQHIMSNTGDYRSQGSYREENIYANFPTGSIDHEFSMKLTERMKKNHPDLIQNIAQTFNPAHRASYNAAMNVAITKSGVTLNSAFATNWSEVSHMATSGLHRALSKIFYGLPITKNTLHGMIRNNLLFPLRFVIARPFMTYLMAMAIKVLPGLETGQTFVTPGDFDLGKNPQIKAILGTYAFYQSVFVHRPENCFVVRGTMLNGYIGGANTVPINPKNFKAGQGNFEGESVIVIPVPYTWDLHGNVLSLTGTLTFGTFQEYSLTKDGRLQYPAARICATYGLQEIRQRGLFDVIPDDEPARAARNLLCWRGTYLKFNPVKNGYTTRVVGQGHFGDNVYPGRKSVINGDMVKFKENPDANFDLE